MLLVVNGTDLTDYVNPSSYSVNEVDQCDSWLDGNLVEHRIYGRSRVAGTFDVFLYGKDGMTTEAFLENWEAAVENHILTAQVFVQNKNTMKTINCYYTFEGTSHREMVNGNYCDKLTITIQER
jgi:hypothetical protein